MNNIVYKGEKLDKVVAETWDTLEQYFEKHKHNAISDRYHWTIGKYSFWIANGPNSITLDCIPEIIFEQLKQDVYDYYNNWLLDNYEFKVEEKKKNIFTKLFTLFNF